MALPQFYDTEIIKADRINENTVLLELKFPEDSEFNFKAGQFVLVYMDVDGKEENRAFSIASAPGKNNIELLIRMYENGKVSPRLFKLSEGDKLKIRGPFGVFNVKKPLSKEIVFIASGTGIAPLRSMMHEIKTNDPETKIKLIFGFRHEEDFFFKEEIEKLKEDGNFNCHICSTRPSETWEHLKGRVTEHLGSVIDGDKEKQFYICGPKEMINDSLNFLIKDMGFDKDRVIIERWGN